MYIDLEEIACININSKNDEIIEPQFWVYLDKTDIRKYRPTDNEIKEEKQTILRVFYNTKTNKVIDSKLVLDYSASSKKSEIDYILSESEQNIIADLIQSDYGQEVINWELGI